MQKQKQEYFNFINSLNSDSTKKIYSYCLQEFLNHSKLDLHKFLKLPEQKLKKLSLNIWYKKRFQDNLRTSFFPH